MGHQEDLAARFPYLPPHAELAAWIAAGGDVPDPDAMPSCAALPDPLAFGGHRVGSPADWPAQREAILAAFRRYVFGTYPPPPRNVVATVLRERTGEDGAAAREVELAFGPDRRGRLHFELLTPPGDGPFPLFITQRNHVGWSHVALSRGWAAVSYNGCDNADDTQAFRGIWPECDWSMLCRRAWGAGRVLDGLLAQPQFDPDRVCITGHSRNGKLSLIAAAIDPRFTAVISSSSGIGGASPYRLANEAHFSEGIELITGSFPQWFHPRLRLFAGREDRLPVDANLLIALAAPRAVLISSAKNDSCESIRANEAAVRAAQSVWDLLGEPGRLDVLWRWGEHETRPEEIERYIDWCELQFGRVDARRAARLRPLFVKTWHFPYTWESWRAATAEPIDATALPPAAPLADALPATAAEWAAGHADRCRRIRLLLGDPPPHVGRDNGKYGLEAAYVQHLLGRPAARPAPEFTAHMLNFGEYLTATCYLPPGVPPDQAAALPLVIWLCPESVSSGYAAAYIRGGRPPIEWVRAGFAAMAFDPIGCGHRLEEATRFHDRHPDWSPLGKMVHDAGRAVDAALQLPYVDRGRIYLVGFGSGATTALLAAAMDARVAGVASVCGFTPMRTDTPDRPTGGLARFWQWPGGGLLPRLGFFDGRQDRIPIDFDEILAAVAPRPLLLVTPTHDREANHEDVLAAVAAARRVYELHDAADALWHDAPHDHRRFSPPLRERLVAKLRSFAGP